MHLPDTGLNAQALPRCVLRIAIICRDLRGAPPPAKTGVLQNRSVFLALPRFSGLPADVFAVCSVPGQIMNRPWHASCIFLRQGIEKISVR
jgi:hypothetical protein